jgi:hypothetical protein
LLKGSGGAAVDGYSWKFYFNGFRF